MGTDKAVRRTWLIGSALALTIAALLVYVSLGFEPSRTGVPALPDYVIDTGIPAAAEGTFAWIDDDTVLFAGYEALEPDKGYRGRTRLALTKWRMGGEVVFLAGLKYSRFCYGAGRISRFAEILADGRRMFFRGPRGQERRQSTRGDEQDAKSILFNDFICDFVPRPARLRQGIVYPLRPGDGYLELRGKYEDGGGAVLHPPGGKPEIQLPVPSDHIDMTCGAYHPWKGAYFLNDCRGTDDNMVGECPAAWWLWPDGQTEKVCVPANMILVRVWPTRAGLVIAHDDHDLKGRIGDTGLYLIAKGRRVKILRGWVEGGAVSPDGCRFVFEHTPTSGSRYADGQWWLGTAKVIDFCKHGDRMLGRP